MTLIILRKKSALNLIATVISYLFVINSAMAAGAPAGGGGARGAEADAAVHTEVAKTTTGAETNALNNATDMTPGNATAIPTFAYDPRTPYYLGGTFGWGAIYQSVFSGPANNSSSGGFAGRVFAGYRFTDNFSVEGGYSKYSNVNGSYTTFDPVFGPINAKGVIRTYVFDAVLKITKPLKNTLSHFNIYTKIGMAYLNETGGTLNTDALLLPSIPGSPVEPINRGNPVGNKLLPTFSFGINYHLMKSLEADLDWMHIQMLGTGGALKNTDMVGLGLAYSF